MDRYVALFTAGLGAALMVASLEGGVLRLPPPSGLVDPTPMWAVLVAGATLSSLVLYLGYRRPWVLARLFPHHPASPNPKSRPEPGNPQPESLDTMSLVKVTSSNIRELLHRFEQAGKEREAIYRLLAGRLPAEKDLERERRWEELIERLRKGVEA